MRDLVHQRRRKSAILRNIIMVDCIPIYPERGLTTADIHQVLLDEGYEISKRTVQRDLEKLSEWAALDYEEDDNSHRRWFRDIKRADVIDVVPAPDAFLLVLSEKLLRKVIPLNLSKKMEEWLKKADAKLASKHLLSKWKSKVNIISDGHPFIDDKLHIDEEDRKVLYDCVLNETQIQITYQSSKTHKTSDYILNPLGLIIREQSHYLVATKNITPEKPQLFLFHRISSVKKLYLDIIKPNTFSIEDYFAKNPTGWLFEDNIETIELKVKGYALDVVTRNKFSQDQILEPYDDFWWKVTFSCHVTYDLISWILKFGHDVVCEAPISIRKKVIHRLKNSLNNYE